MVVQTHGFSNPHTCVDCHLFKVSNTSMKTKDFTKGESKSRYPKNSLITQQLNLEEISQTQWQMKMQLTKKYKKEIHKFVSVKIFIILKHLRIKLKSLKLILQYEHVILIHTILNNIKNT